MSLTLYSFVVITPLGTMVVRSMCETLFKPDKPLQDVFDACLVVSRPVKAWRTSEGAMINEETLDKMIVSDPSLLDSLEELTIGSQDDYIPLNKNIDLLSTKTTLNQNTVIMFWEASAAISENINNIMGRSEIKKVDLPQGF